MTDIVGRLREYSNVDGALRLPRLCGEAADEIERLRSIAIDADDKRCHAENEIERLRVALHKSEASLLIATLEIERLRAALLVAQQWMPTPQQALVPSAKADAELVERALTGRKGDA